nr:class IIb bacteriocin, lactobin A/cerein 7B family [Mongoliibacter ruber]
MEKFKELSFEEMQEVEGGWLKEAITAGFAYCVYLYDKRDRFIEGIKKGWEAI